MKEISHLSILKVTQLHNRYETFTDNLLKTYGTNKILILNGNLQFIDIINQFKLIYFIIKHEKE